MVRNERYRKNTISVRERHNERKNEVYSKRTAPQQVQAFLLGIQRRRQAERQLNRAQRCQRARGQER